MAGGVPRRARRVRLGLLVERDARREPLLEISGDVARSWSQIPTALLEWLARGGPPPVGPQALVWTAEPPPDVDEARPVPLDRPEAAA